MFYRIYQQILAYHLIIENQRALVLIVECFKTRIMKRLKNKFRKTTSIAALMFAIGGLFLTSCETVGYDGLDGRSYLALTYTGDEPDYIDAGTGSIPEYFYWDEYYRARPGFYTMYYDGVFYKGFSLREYAWELDYEIYFLEGEPGGYGYNGSDAPDTYFTIECNPYGPYYYEDSYKASLAEGTKVLSESEDKIVVEKTKGQYGMKVTYSKVEKRK